MKNSIDEVEGSPPKQSARFLGALLWPMLAGSLIQKIRGRWKFVGAACGLIVAVLVNSSSFVVAAQHNKKQEIESTLSSMPIFLSLKKYDPNSYEELVRLLERAVEDGYTEQKTRDIARAQIAAFVKSRISHASDDAILSYMHVMIAELEELETKGSDLCYKSLFPQAAGGINPLEVYSQDLQKRDLEAVNQVIRTSNTKRPVPEKEDVIQYVAPINRQLYQKYGEELSIFNDPTQPGVDKGKVCTITKELYSEILELPVDEAALTFRWVFSQE